MTSRVVSLLMIVAIASFSSCRGKKQGDSSSIVRPVKVMEVKQSNTFEKNFAGVVESNKVSVLGFRYSGQLVNLSVNDGDWLNKGQLIAKQDPKDRQLQLDADKASFLAAQSQYERYKVLLARQAISKQELEVAETSFQKAKAVYENTQNMVADLNLYAPFTGFVLKKSVENYQTVQAGQEVVKFVDPSDLVVKLTLADKNLDYLLTKPTFKVSVETITGVIFNAVVRDYVDASPYGLGIPVTLRIEDPKYNQYRKAIKPGFSVNVVMTVTDKLQKNSEVIVPLVAVASETNTKKNYVWLVDSKAGVVSKRYVQIGPLSGVDNIAIKSGLSSGDVVVTAGVYQLAEGQKVKILPN